MRRRARGLRRTFTGTDLPPILKVSSSDRLFTCTDLTQNRINSLQTFASGLLAHCLALRPMTDRPRFHLAFPVHDLDEARAFYGGVLGCPEGRSAPEWVDFDFFGHQIVA